MLGREPGTVMGSMQAFGRYRKDKHPFPRWSTSNSQVMKRRVPCCHHAISLNSGHIIQNFFPSPLPLLDPSRPSCQPIRCCALRVTATWVERGVGVCEPNRPAGGARHSGSRPVPCGLSFLSSSVRIFSMDPVSSMQAMIRSAPPQARQVSISIPNSCCRRCIRGTLGATCSTE